MAREISKTDAASVAAVTSDSPVNREGDEHRGFKVATPVGEIALSIRTPRYRAPVSRFFDPFGIADRAVGVAKLGLRLASWGEEQVFTILRNRLDAVDSSPRALSAGSGQTGDPSAETLNAKMGRLLDRALDQSTRGSQVELYHRLLDQLVADEARILGALSDGSASPLVNVHAWARPRVPGQAVLENACLIGRTANVALPTMVPQYVGHLLALGLVETGPEDPGMKGDYEVLMAETMVLRAIKSASRGPLTARVEKLTLSLSGLGQALWAATMQDGAQ